jgi:hypothetical protein
MALGWIAAAVVFGAAAATSLPLALLLWRVAHLAAMAIALVAGAALALAAFSALRARGRRAQARAKMHQAWTTVAGELVAARGSDVTSADVARALSIDERYAEDLLSELSAEGRVRVAVGEDAQLSYRPSPGAEAEPPSPEDTAASARRGP